ncbi:MAG: hypothetical protein HUU29_12610 [Planctomycetaceae bacterium]|nr:hypothetical protein [Planctomycetaceae bacterium]
MIQPLEILLAGETLASVLAGAMFAWRYQSMRHKLESQLRGAGHDGLSEAQSAYLNGVAWLLGGAVILLAVLTAMYCGFRIWGEADNAHWSWAAAWGGAFTVGMAQFVIALFDWRARVAPFWLRLALMLCGLACIGTAPLSAFFPWLD